MIFLLSIGSMSWAAPSQSEGSEQAELTEPSEEDRAQQDLAEEQQTVSQAVGLPLHIQLINGIVLKGTAELEQVVRWKNGEDLSLISEDGSTFVLAGNRIANVLSLTVVPDASEVEQGVNLTVGLINGIELSGTAGPESVVQWNEGQDLTFKPYGQKQLVLNGEQIYSLYQYDEEIKTKVVAVKPAVQLSDVSSEEQDERLPYVSPEGFSYPNPAASRYLYAPSSIPMKQGQGYVSQKLVITSSAYAINDTTTLLAGTFTFAPPLLTVIGVKKSFKINEESYIAIGTEAFFVPIDSEMLLGIGFASYTYGNLDRHFSIAAGIMGGDIFTSDVLSSQGPSIPIVVSGHKRLSDRAALVTENWLITNINDLGEFSNGAKPVLATANSLAFRILGKRDEVARKRAYTISIEGYPRTTWDVGLIFVTYREQSSYRWSNTEEIPSEFVGYSMLGPLPWIDFAWHFGPSGG